VEVEEEQETLTPPNQQHQPLQLMVKLADQVVVVDLMEHLHQLQQDNLDQQTKHLKTPV
jgi:hypothetical protein